MDTSTLGLNPMDVNTLRAVITTVSLLLFVGICVWAYSKRQHSRFDEAAHLPFADDEMQQRTVDQERQHG